jgi:hypothetical protein
MRHYDRKLIISLQFERYTTGGTDSYNIQLFRHAVEHHDARHYYLVSEQGRFLLFSKNKKTVTDKK